MESHNAIDIVRAKVIELHIEASYKIASADEAVSANDILGKVKTLNKTIVDAKSAELAPLNDQVKAVREKYREAEAMVLQAEETLKRALVIFRQEETKRLEEVRRLEILAAEKEKARLEKQADKAREKGQEEKADALELTAQLVSAPIEQAAPTALAGASFRETWKGKVTNLSQFLTSLASSPYELEDVVKIHQPGLDRLAKTMKTNMSKILPGAVAVMEETMAVRGK